MSSYHGWTHQLKEDGGTDPIPGLEDLIGGAAPTPWAVARNLAVATNVADSASWTDMTLGDVDVAVGQTALSAVTNGIQIDEDGIYLITLALRWNSGAGTGTWAQGAIKTENSGGTLGSRRPTQKTNPFNFDDFEDNRVAVFYSIPGEQGFFRRIKASARQVGGGTTQTPQCMISVVQLTALFDGVPPLAWL